MNDIISNPVVWKVLIAYWVFSAAVGALPTPTANSNPGYVWAFRFCHGLAGNIGRAAVALHVPGAANENADAAAAGK